MHTFFIDTTKENYFDNYASLFYKDIKNFNLTPLKSSIFDLSNNVGAIQQIVDKEVSIRDDFNIIIAVSINKDDLPVGKTIEDYKKTISFLVNQNLIWGLRSKGFNPQKIGLLFMEDHDFREEENYTLSTDEILDYSIFLWPWNEVNYEFDINSPTKEKIVKEWLDYITSEGNSIFELVNGKKDARDFLEIFDKVYEETKENAGKDEKEFFTEDHNYEYRKDLAVSNYQAIIEKRRFLTPVQKSVQLHERDSEEREKIILESVLSVLESINGDIFELDIDIEDEEVSKHIIEALEIYKQILVENINILEKKSFPEFKLFNDEILNKEDHLEIGKPKFKPRSVSNEVGNSLKGFIYKGKTEEIINNFIDTVTTITSDNEKNFKNDIHEILRAFKYKKEEIIYKGTKNLIFSHKKEEKCTQDNINRYEKEIENKQSKIKVDLTKQNLNDYEIHDFSGQIASFRHDIENYLDILKNFRFFTFLFMFSIIVISFIVPYSLTDDFNNDIALYIFIGTSIIAVAVGLIALYIGIVQIKKKILIRVIEFENEINENQKKLETVYLEFYKRFNQYIPNLLYLKIYLDWMKKDTSRKINDFRLRQYHIKSLKEHLKTAEKLFRLFSDRNEIPLNYYNSYDINILDVNKNIVENAEVYTLENLI